jgi:hypothetical protein
MEDIAGMEGNNNPHVSLHVNAMASF